MATADSADDLARKFRRQADIDDLHLARSRVGDFPNHLVGPDDNIRLCLELEHNGCKLAGLSGDSTPGSFSYVNTAVINLATFASKVAYGQQPKYAVGSPVVA